MMNPIKIPTGGWQFSLYNGLSVMSVVVVLALNGCARPQIEERSASVEGVVAQVQNPEMRQIWRDAQANNKLPPISKIPILKNPVSRRSVLRVATRQSKPRRPHIPENAVISVEPFSEKQIERYEGLFNVTSHEILSHSRGVVRGRIADQDDQFEIWYKLPGEQEKTNVEVSSQLYLRYRDEVIDNALQRHIILIDSENGRAPLGLISEGSQEPYYTVIEELDLSIMQGTEGGNPPVTINYMGQTVTLMQGERKIIGKEKQNTHGSLPLNVYLLNSYARTKNYNDVESVQAFYINIIFYQ